MGASDDGDRKFGTDLLVIQPTPFCNLDCRYCYLPNRGDTSRIAPETLDAAFRIVLQSGRVARQVTVLWHAGEPLVMPVAFYRDALHRAARATPPGLEVDHAVQTNGVLIDDGWCRFFLESGLRIGVSLDGPAFLHDRNRRTRRGGDTHAQTMAGIGCLQKYGVPFHVITVLTRPALDFADELFEFYTNCGIQDVCFNIEEIEGANRTSSLDTNGIAARYREFMARFLARVGRHGEEMRVREFDYAYGAIRGFKKVPPYNHQTRPFGIVSIDCHGNISTFSPELLGQAAPEFGDFIFGNVRDHSLADVARNRQLRELARAIALGVRRCEKTCEFFPVCGGGAPANKYYEHRSFAAAETLYCKLMIKAPIEVVLDEIEHSRSAIADPSATTHREAVE